MSGLEVSGLTVRFGDRVAVDDVDLTVSTGEVVCLLGPSGSGKSTLLRAVAGLERPASGTVRWDGVDLADVAPHRRRFGLVFQDYALFPHLDVAGNVGFGLRMRGTGPTDLARRTGEVLELVGMADAGGRAVGRLSGGEQQRVALARALAPEPRLLLLDEPLGALDRMLRERLVVELGELLREVGVTAVHVTHDQEEAFALADRVAVLDGGRLVQVGTPAQVWSAPASSVVARFLGFPVLPVTVTGGTADTPWGAQPVPRGTAEGGVGLVLRPDALSLDPAGQLPGTVLARAFRGERWAVRVATEVGALEVTTPPSAAPAVGAAAVVAVDPARVVVVPG